MALVGMSRPSLFRHRLPVSISAVDYGKALTAIQNVAITNQNPPPRRVVNKDAGGNGYSDQVTSAAVTGLGTITVYPSSSDFQFCFIGFEPTQTGRNPDGGGNPPATRCLQFLNNGNVNIVSASTTTQTVTWTTGDVFQFIRNADGTFDVKKNGTTIGGALPTVLTGSVYFYGSIFYQGETYRARLD